MNTFFTADWHLGETRFEIMGRPFSDAQEHVNCLIGNHNSVVAPDDQVIVVGDACYDPKWLAQVARFNGRKTLVRGNYDRQIGDEEFSKYFEKIVQEGDGIEMEYAGIPLWATHYPTRGRKDCFNLVGHIHAAWKVQLNSLNVGVDVHFLRPMPIERVKFFHDAVCKFYDEDCWVAYSECNSEYRKLRGKPGSYFQAGKP
jgi:calcineurin-like phosphoesterase family protein